VLAVIFRLILALLAFRLIGGAVRAMRSGPAPEPKGSRREPRAGAEKVPQEKADPYSDLTPYEIEDAEFEDLSGRED
jgi:hypothetical protein